MTRRPARHSRTERSRELRNNKTKSESLLWSVLRSRQLGGLKFRRQHPIGPYFADFACLDRHAVVELDGEYHDYQYEMDRKRQAYMESMGWQVIRFANEEVLADVDAVATSLSLIGCSSAVSSIGLDSSVCCISCCRSRVDSCSNRIACCNCGVIVRD